MVLPPVYPVSPGTNGGRRSPAKKPARVPASPGFRIHLTTHEPRSQARRAREALGATGGVLYYALGGGLGHLTRALAIRRHWARLTPAPFITFTNCAYAVPEDGDVLQLDDPHCPPTALAELLRALMDALQPSVWVVDAFPAGILGELTPLLESPCPKAVLLRCLKPEWIAKWALAEILPRYDLVLRLEAAAPAWPHARLVAAPLIRDAEDLLPRADARDRIGAGSESVVGAVVTGRTPAELGILGLARRLGERHGAAVRLFSAGGVVPGTQAYHPTLELLPGVDALLGPSGFNLFHEARATSTPAIWIPQPRLYDDQRARAREATVARSPAECEALLARALADPRPTAAPYPNGAAEVAAALLALT